jgi:hypothetical protein
MTEDQLKHLDDEIIYDLQNLTTKPSDIAFVSGLVSLALKRTGLPKTAERFKELILDHLSNL